MPAPMMLISVFVMVIPNLVAQSSEPVVVPPSSRDPDWLQAFEKADLLYAEEGRPDFKRMTPIQSCDGRDVAGRRRKSSNCSSLFWPGLGNGFLGSIAQSPTLRIAGVFSGNSTRYASGGPVPAIPKQGFSSKEVAYRARIPAYASSIDLSGSALLSGTSRSALNTRDAVYYERTGLSGGGEVELQTYFHRVRRNLIVVQITLNCSTCTQSTSLSLNAFSGEPSDDVVFQTKAAGKVGVEPRQLMGWMITPESNLPSTTSLYDTNYSLGYAHDLCPENLTAEAGQITSVQLLSVLTVSSETKDEKEAVVTRALDIYHNAKSTNPEQLLDEHRTGWAALWDSGGIELTTTDLDLQQITNATLYYLLMSTRSDWLFSTLTPSSIAASAPYPHGYYGATFWDQETFMAPPLLVFYPSIAENLLRNRLHQLPAYKLNAKAFGLKGAYVPWMVGGTGGFVRDNLINHIEVHIGPDIALFIKQYYQTTNDVTMLRELYPLLEGISQFVVARVNGTNEKGEFTMRTMIGADEENGNHMDNDIWTNAVSVQALETTLDAATKLGMPSDPKWREAAAKIKIGFFADQLLHKEFDDYTGSTVGQGDTVLVGFPGQFNDSHRVWHGSKSQTRLNDIRYYGQRIDPDGSYMTAGHYVIAWLERSHRNESAAAEWFATGQVKNFAPWRLWSEHDHNDGGAVNFITAGGMFLQSLIFGYGGVRFNDNGISLDPVMPPQVKAMKLRGLNYADAEYDVEMTPMTTRFSRRSLHHDSGNVHQHKGDDGVYWLQLKTGGHEVSYV